MNCAKFSLAFFAQLETENVIFFLAIFCSDNTAYFRLQLQPKRPLFVQKTSLVNQRLKSLVILRGVSLHSELLTPMCFQESHPSRGWSLKGRPAAGKVVPITSPLGVFCVPIPVLSERMFPRQTCMRNFHPFCILSAERALHAASLPAKPTCEDVALLTCARAMSP